MEVRKNWRSILSLLLLVILFYWAVTNLSLLGKLMDSLISAFQPFIIGGMLAFILNQPIKEIEKGLAKWQKEFKGWFRPFAIIVSFLLVFLLLFFVIFLVIPDLQQTITSFIEVVPVQVSNSIDWFNHFIDKNPEVVQLVQEIDVDLNSLRQSLIDYAQSFATNTLGNLIGFITTTVSSIVTIFIALVFAFFLLLNKEKITRQFKKLIYSIWSLTWANFIVNVGRKTNEVFSNFVGGSIIEGFILGTLVYIGMSVFGFPFKLSISVITGTLALIPIYGAIIGGIIGVLLISVVNFTQALWFILFILILQQIEGNIIYPRVVGNSVGLPGIWVVVSVTVAGSFFGLAGMLVSVPLASVLYAFVSDTVNHRLASVQLHVDYDSKNL